MAESFEQQAGNRRKRLIRIFTLVSLAAFIGQTAFSSIQTFRGALNQPDPAEQAQTQANSQQAELQAQERGYKAVLAREPENPTALEGLANVRIQMNNPQGAIESLEKLIQIYPNREDYKALLEQVKAPNP
ncbi:MAG: tetratricopeptide repeat protein [Microcoleaceae cyanobacterium]